VLEMPARQRDGTRYAASLGVCQLDQCNAMLEDEPYVDCTAVDLCALELNYCNPPDDRGRPGTPGARASHDMAAERRDTQEPENTAAFQTLQTRNIPDPHTFSLQNRNGDEISSVFQAAAYPSRGEWPPGSPLLQRTIDYYNQGDCGDASVSRGPVKTTVTYHSKSPPPKIASSQASLSFSVPFSLRDRSRYPDETVVRTIQLSI
jgi:hypothetical protein